MHGYPDGQPAGRYKPAVTPAVLAGYFWSGDDSYYSYDSTGGTVTVAANTPYLGYSQVTFAGLAAIGDTAGDAQVTGYDTTDTCAVAGWGPVSTDEVVDVACYTPAGTLDTSEQSFDVTITEPVAKPSGVYDYAWVSPDNSSQSLGHGFGEYNSAHKANRVVHLGTGRYEVVFPGPKSSGQHGTVEVSPYTRYQTPGGDCVDAGWTGTRTGVDVYVDCYSGTGSHGRQNRLFDVVYASANNVLGLNGAADANVTFSGRGTTATPVESYFSSRHAEAIAAQDPAGVYALLLPGSAGLWADFGGDVQAGAVSAKDYHCSVTEWDTAALPYISLECFNSAGHPVSTPYTVQWVNLEHLLV